VCVEVNTAGLRKPVAEIYPHPSLLRACYEAGVPATLASDAHAPAEVGCDFQAGLQLLREVGYTAYVRFAQRKRALLAIEEGPRLIERPA
jgi:histidinol-phosphatase (PHP family)